MAYAICYLTTLHFIHLAGGFVQRNYKQCILKVQQKIKNHNYIGLTLFRWLEPRNSLYFIVSGDTNLDSGS